MDENQPKLSKTSKNEETHGFGSNRNTNLILSLSAITISLFTLFILIYQSHLLSRQFELAQKQQFASVLPYLEMGPSFGMDYFRFLIMNTGIGPAFIKDVFIYENGEKYQLDLYGYVSEFSTPDDSLGSIRYSSLFSGRVIQPGTEFLLIASDESVQDAQMLRNFFMKREHFMLVIEYASVFNERWIIDSRFLSSPIRKDEYILPSH